MGGGMGGTWTYGFVGPFLGLLVMGVIVYVLWTAVNGGNDRMNHQRTTNDAMETLRARYARGEIDDDEFEERARRLRDK